MEGSIKLLIHDCFIFAPRFFWNMRCIEVFKDWDLDSAVLLFWKAQILGQLQLKVL